MAAALMLRENDRFFRRERVFLDRYNPLDRPDDFLLRAYRFPRHKIIELCNELRPDLEKATLRSHSIPVELQVLSALRFYASGSFQNVIGDVFGLSQPSISRCINDVTDALVRRINQYIKFPDEAERRTNKSDFYKIAHFPNVVGVIDGTHIPIKAPNDNEYQYVNRKNFHSINVQCICDANFKIINAVSRWPGSTHDSYIWNNSQICRQFEEGDIANGWLLGDSGYALKPWMLVPFMNPSTPAEEEFNRRHCRTRVTIEQLFGIVKSRFRCVHKTGGCLCYVPAKCCRIIAAVFILHNICVDNNIPCLENDNVPDEHNDLNPPLNEGVVCGNGQQVRRNIAAQFV
ncbi:Hypothetical predicted protein [Mytilus galloprovincialis]|uniref:Putative nuclease HARBI1 n=1 Tax=Mytilus galloprovincialis TaxID=29158 RepID=A0A8B6E8G6_MYTGA|nr:Hypothetical predicted protein [Mytilus galloprovincialis]